MTPEERSLLERTLKLSEENNKMLRKMRRAAIWGLIWDIIKISIIVVPIIIGYLYLEPQLGTIHQLFTKAVQLLNQ